MLNEIRYERNPEFIYRRIVDESVLVPLHNNVADMNCIYTLNEIGAFIWEHLNTPVTSKELEDALLLEYDAEPDELIRDLSDFLEELVSIKALREV